ncbi:F plasmid transfer operon protein TraF [Modicisalibacter xianhensis]|uniref:F plasmid transfer operon protein TraF n=2 Tax=Modicisalibacter xianhensis TaxID=442341 RepID=A0A4R8FN71_9GAMM|nr:F plasmid transfer operon protein TraF [Halomonas xianhensis]
MYLQRYAMDRSSQFADVTQLAVVGDPWLDESVRRPTASFASQDLDRQAGNARNQLLSALAERVGIFFFYSSDCAMCEAQVPIMKMAQRDFKVVPISLDGKDLPSAPFSDVKADSGHAEMLGVEQLPAIYLASPDGQFAPIAQGAIALNEMRERMIIAARKAGWVTEEEFNKTRPILNLEDNLSEVLPMDALGSAASEGETNFIPPAELLNIINHTTQGN